MLKDVETRLKDVQSAFRDLLPPDAVLCGHSVENDLIALKVQHFAYPRSHYNLCLSQHSVRSYFAICALATK